MKKILLFFFLFHLPAPLISAEEIIHMPVKEDEKPVNIPSHAEFLPEVNMWITSEATENPHSISEQSVPRTQAAVPDDPYTNRQWPLDKLNWDESFPYADEAEGTVTVAVIDSGVDASHPDLRGQVRKDGYNFIHNDINTMDRNSHGTKVAGIIAAQTGNATGITGYTGGFDVEILPVKIMDESGKGSSADIIRAVNFALEKEADILHLSLGADTYSRTEERAMEAAIDQGVAVVASAGNDGNDSRFYPASHESVFSIGSLDRSLKRSGFSNYNPSVDFTAPGEYMYTTDLGGGYSYQNGTSFSAPMVTSIIAMMKAIDPDLSIAEIDSLLKRSALDLGATGRDVYYGHGTVLPALALREMLFVPFDDRETVADDKVWTVLFNREIDPATLEGNVYVTDEKGNKERITVTHTDDSIDVRPPFFGYERNQTYTLYVEDDIRTKEGEPISRSVQQEFIID